MEQRYKDSFIKFAKAGAFNELWSYTPKSILYRLPLPTQEYNFVIWFHNLMWDIIEIVSSKQPNIMIRISKRLIYQKSISNYKHLKNYLKQNGIYSDPDYFTELLYKKITKTIKREKIYVDLHTDTNDHI